MNTDAARAAGRKYDSTHREARRAKRRAYENSPVRKAYRAANRERDLARCREYYRAHKAESKEAAYWSHLRRLYGLTREAYDALVSAQGGVCAACQRPEGSVERGTLRHLAVDHDHMTGHVRGLLCHGCNSALGRVDDDPARLRALIAYLEVGGVVAG